MPRYQGVIPGVFYGVDADGHEFKQLIQVEEKLVAGEMRKRGMELENTLYKLDIEGVAEHLVVARNTQINPIRDTPLSINFLKYTPGVRVRIPVVFVGMEDSTDIKRGAYLVRVNRFVECVCEGDTIPRHITVDVSKAKQKDVIRLKQVRIIHIHLPPYPCFYFLLTIIIIIIIIIIINNNTKIT